MATEKVIKVTAETGEAVKNIDKLNDTTEKSGKTAKKTSGDFSGLSGQVDKMTGGAITGLKGMKASIMGVTTGLKTMKGALLATGLGALVVILGSVIAAFKGSEEGQNKFNKILGVTGAIVGNVIDLLADLGDFIISVFEDPKKAIKDFAKLIKENIVNRFEGILELIPGLGKAIKKLFKGDFSGAAKTAGDAILKVATGVENYSDKVRKAGQTVKEFIKEQEEEGKAAGRVADMRAKADKIERGLLTRRATLENEIAQLRLKSRQEGQFSAEERRQALLDAQKLEDELLDKETEALQLRADAQSMENTFARSNKENLDEEARLQAAVINQETKRANKARQLQRELNTLNNQLSAEEKSRIAEEQKLKDEAAKVDQELAKATQQARIKNIQDEKEKIEAEFQLKIAGIRKKYGEGTELEAELLKAKNRKLDEVEAKNKEEKRQKELEDREKKKALLEQFRQEDQQQKLIREEQEALAELNRLDATEAEKAKVIEFYANKRTDIAEKNKEEKIKQEEILKQQTIQMTAQTFGAIANILGEQSKAGKAFAVAQALINTYQGITAAVASAPFPFNVPAITAAAVTGFGAVKNIVSTNVDNPSSSAGGASSANATRGTGRQAQTPQVRAPEFNVVGDSGTNQIADVLGRQTNKPQKAYVVSGEVSNQQELDRSIEAGASLG